MKRRQCLAAGLLLPALASATGLVKRPTLHFPADHGSHPTYAIEWWYVTGHLASLAQHFGFQLTFFRSRVPATQTMRSGFAAKQLLFAHAAVTNVTDKRMQHDQRIARSSGQSIVNLASASETTTQVAIGSWQLNRKDHRYLATANGADFSFELSLSETQPILLQGVQGWSQKGPLPKHASFYYSVPQLQATGEVRLGDKRFKVQGKAWLDHEWSNSVIPPQAVGWDWIGVNLFDGTALTVFRLRSPNQDAVWAGGSLRRTGQSNAEVFEASDVQFSAVRRWQSAHSGSIYPVEWLIRVKRHPVNLPILTETYHINALVDDQELDSQATTGAVYWEGLCQLSNTQGEILGMGYLEMTGYAKALHL